MTASTSPPPVELLSIPEAAKRLTLSIRALRSLLANGEIAFIRVTTRRIAVEETELVRFVAERRQRTQ